jgi:S1-C subfamily serine protease
MTTTIPQSNATSKFQKTMGGSIKSLINPGTRTYFVLEHKTATEKHAIGESANYMTDYVEIGRGDNYAVNFGDDCKTVSRPHAAISRRQSDWIITPLSKTNATLLNGHVINGDTLLKNGDEIQLSSGGPKFSFLIPANPKVSGLNFTIRMKAAMNEAVRPYRKTIGVVIALFILGLGSLGYFSWNAHKDVVATQKELAETKVQLQQALKNQDSLSNMVRKINIKTAAKENAVPVTPHTRPPEELSDLYSNIYYIRTEKFVSTVQGETKEWAIAFAGTGFLLKDGRFVTARHVVEPWNYILSLQSRADTILLELNIIAHNGGKVTQYFTAESSSGEKINLTSDDFNTDGHTDVKQACTDDNGGSYYVTTPTLDDGTDWAVYKTEKTRPGLVFDKDLSTSLKASNDLEILGYPFGIESRTPKYTTCRVSLDKTDNGMIDITNIGIEHGNSGGPVFVKNADGSRVVIGIVSTGRSNQGAIVPINNVPE